METAIVIEKVIEGYDYEKIMSDFIEISFFTYEIFVENDFCDNNCNVLEFLVGASLCFGLLTEDIEKKIQMFQDQNKNITNNFFRFLIDLARSIKQQYVE